MVSKHRLVNPDGDEILLPCFAINALSALSCLYRGSGGLPRITDDVYITISFATVMSAGPQPLRAIDYSRPRTNGGAHTATEKFLNALGPNVEGCRLVMCDCEEDEDAD